MCVDKKDDFSIKDVIFIKVLAFDQALIKTGVCVLNNETMAHTLINLSKEKDKRKRFYKMVDSIKQKINEVNPDLVIVEGVALQRSPSTLIELANLQGVIFYICRELNITCISLLPTEWRKELGFKQGRVKREDLKTQAINYIKTNYKEVVSTDEADAICIAVAAMLKFKIN